MQQNFQLFKYTVELELDRSDNAEIPENVRRISAPSQWYDTEGEDTIIGIIDTGCQLDHDDLKDAIVDSRNFCKGGDPVNANDDNGHGTHVAGIIGARRNRTGICGVAPKCKLVIAKALDRRGNGGVNDIIAALKWLTAWQNKDGQRVDVVNLSIGLADDIPNLHRAVKAAVARGITLVCAVGNSGDGRESSSEVAYPAYYDETISVAAVDNAGNPMGFSNTNDQIDVAAPGSKIRSTMIGNRLGLLTGTSMSAPHIAGCACLIINKYLLRIGKRPSPETVKDFIRYFTCKNSTTGLDPVVGAGVFDFLELHIPDTTNVESV